MHSCAEDFNILASAHYSLTFAQHNKNRNLARKNTHQVRVYFLLNQHLAIIGKLIPASFHWQFICCCDPISSSMNYLTGGSLNIVIIITDFNQSGTS